MSYREEERTKLRRQSSRQAIALAMEGRWREAVAANKSLLESFPDDVDAYNRLGRAYMELGEYSLAGEAYAKARELDPYNAIARKNLIRLAHLGEASVGAEDGGHRVEPQQFIEEAGKAGIVSLHHLAPPEVLARMVAGAQLNLVIEPPNLIVTDSRGDYLGRVETKDGQRLIKLIEEGNRYTVTFISSAGKAAKIIIREVYQAPSQMGQVSFPARGSDSFRPYVGDRIIRREIEYEEALPDKPGYTIVGGEEAEVLAEEAVESDADEETDEPVNED